MIISGTGLKASGTGWKVSSTGLKVSGSGLKVSGSGWKASGTELKVSGSGLRVSGTGWQVDLVCVGILNPVLSKILSVIAISAERPHRIECSRKIAIRLEPSGTFDTR